MSPVHSIAQLIADVYSRRSGLPAGKSPAPMDQHVAASLVASGLFLQSEFTSAADLDGLPWGSVVRTVATADARRAERFFRRLPTGWHCLTDSTGSGQPCTAAELLARHSDGTAVLVWDGAKR